MALHNSKKLFQNRNATWLLWGVCLFTKNSGVFQTLATARLDRQISPRSQGYLASLYLGQPMHCSSVMHCQNLSETLASLSGLLQSDAPSLKPLSNLPHRVCLCVGKTAGNQDLCSYFLIICNWSKVSIHHSYRIPSVIGMVRNCILPGLHSHGKWIMHGILLWIWLTLRIAKTSLRYWNT